jgi:hypothetical protein
LVPTPFLDTLVALMLARTLMTAVKHGIFGVVARGRQSADKIAAVTGGTCPGSNVRKFGRTQDGDPRSTSWNSRGTPQNEFFMIAFVDKPGGSPGAPRRVGRNHHFCWPGA